MHRASLSNTGDDEAVDELLASARTRSLKGMEVPRHPGAPVTRRALTLSRIATVLVVIGYFWVVFPNPPFGLMAFLILPVAGTCFTNTVAAATGRLSVSERVSRPSRPRPLMVVSWLVLLLPVWSTALILLFRG